MCNDDMLLARRLADDLAGGFEDLALAYAGRLYAFALRLGASREDAEEIAQDTLMRAYRALAGYDAPRRRELRLRAWLFAIAVNVRRNRVRGRQLPSVPLEPRRDDDGDETRTAAHELAADTRETPEARAEAGETRRELAAALLTLPARLREAVVLRHVQGLSYAEAAEALGGIPVGTVKAQVHRGTRLLRTALEARDGAHAVGGVGDAGTRKTPATSLRREVRRR
jgi:RNA polymerase sigma factor (sigma-70 family)